VVDLRQAKNALINGSFYAYYTVEYISRSPAERAIFEIFVFLKSGCAP